MADLTPTLGSPTPQPPPTSHHGAPASPRHCDREGEQTSRLPSPPQCRGDAGAPWWDVGGAGGGASFVRARALLALRESVAFAAVLLMIGVVAAAFTWPWLPRPPAGGEWIAKYSPLR